MKKLSVLIALALCLTITGAYAAWSFATGAVADAKVENIKIGMHIEDNQDAMGKLTATFSPEYLVEPDTGNVPKLHNNNPAKVLTITFTTDADAEKSVKDNGIAVDVSIAVSKAFTGTANEITKTTVITAKAENGVTIERGTSNWSRVENVDGSVTFTATVSSDVILSWLQVDGTAVTDLKTAQALKAAVEAGELTITITPNVG